MMDCVEKSKVSLTISHSLQKLSWSDGVDTKQFPISTSRFGIGTEEGSNKTPLGLFQISEKYGENHSQNTIYRGRKAIASYLPQFYCEDQGDFILARILRLTGLDCENHNTFSRYIYLHGTNHEALIGTPASLGCVRMLNKDIVDLYELCPLGSKVIII